MARRITSIYPQSATFSKTFYTVHLDFARRFLPVLRQLFVAIRYCNTHLASFSTYRCIRIGMYLAEISQNKKYSDSTNLRRSGGSGYFGLWTPGSEA